MAEISADVQSVDTILIEMEVHTGVGVETLRFCNGSGIVVDGLFYLPRINNPGSIRNFLFSEGTTSGPSSLGFGVVSLLNSDGALDYLLNYGFTGRVMNIKGIIAGAVVLLASCSMEQPVFDFDQISVRIKDPQAVLEVPVQETKYLGDNTGPDGLEGGEELKGKEKPLMFGTVYNAEPERVNFSRQTYQVNDGAVQSITAVYDKGVEVKAGPVYTSLADMLANEPAPYTYRAYLPGGYFRLGSTPIGQVTFDGVEGSSASMRTRAQIAKRIAMRKLSAFEIHAPSFTTFDANSSEEVGIYIKSGQMKISDAINKVLAPRGWFAFDTNRMLHVGMLAEPAGTPLLGITKDQILSIERKATDDAGRGVPAYKVDLNYLKNNTVQGENALAGSVNATWVTGTMPAYKQWVDIAYGNGVFVALPKDSINIARSTDDGVTFQYEIVPQLASSRITFQNGVFVAIVQEQNALFTSPDGWTWTQHTIGAGGAGLWYDIMYVNGLWVVVGDGQISTSPNLVNWTSRTVPVAGAQYRRLAYGAGVLLCATSYATGNTLFKSVDGGITWSATTPFSAGEFANKIVYADGVFVVAPGSTNVLYPEAFPHVYISFDGAVWQQVSTGVPISGYVSLIHGDGLFRMTGILGSTGASVMLTSPNGINWTPVQTMVPNNALQIAYGNGVLIGLRFDTTTEYYRQETVAGVPRRVFVASEFRSVTATDPAVQTPHPNAVALKFDSLLTTYDNAQAEVNVLLNLHKVRRDYMIVTCKRSALPATLPVLGSVVRLTHDRFGLNNGKLFIFLGTDLFLGTDQVKLYFWG